VTAWAVLFASETNHTRLEVFSAIDRPTYTQRTHLVARRHGNRTPRCYS
jgi:hypothetical protein